MTSSTRDVRTAMIGHGFIAHVHMDALRRLGVNITGLLDTSFDLAASGAAEDGIPKAYHDIAELAADDTIDVVHITSPNYAHAEQSLALLRSGKHVVCEKPLAMTVAQAKEMVDAAAASGKVNAVCFHNRFYPLSAQARAMVASGELGDIRLVLGHYLQDWLALDTDWNWRLDPELGGDSRAVGDIGSHWLDLVEHVTGDRVQEVIADLKTFIPVRKMPEGPVETFTSATGATKDVPIKTEDAGLILLRFASGARGQLVVSQVSQGHNNELAYELNGSKQSIRWVSENSEQMWIGHRGAPDETLARNPSLTAPGAAGWLPGGHSQGLPDAFTAMFKAVYDDVLAGGPSANPRYATFADGLRGLEIEQAITASARNGAWTKVGTS